MKCAADHKHAINSTCYIIHKCRCDECRVAQTARAKQRRKLQAYGRFDSGLVDAQPVREHVQMLQAAGMGWKRIAEVSGVGKTAVSQLIYGRKGSNKDPRKGEVLKRFGREKAEKLLAVKPEISNLGPGALIDARGFRRRAEALICMGWSMSKQADALGMERRNFGILLKRDRITVRYHLAMVDLFNAWWDKRPERSEHRDLIDYNRTVNLAVKRGYVAPLGWDDIDNDDAPVDAANTAGKEHYVGEVEWLLNAGLSPLTVAEQLGSNLIALERLLHRHGRGDLAAAIRVKAVA